MYFVRRETFALISNHFCSGQRCSIKRLALIVYIVLLVTAAAFLIWAGLYLYFVPAIASIALLFFGIACNCRPSAVKTGPGQHSDQSASVSSETQVKIVDVFHPLELNHVHPTVHLIERHGNSCRNLQPWRYYTHTELIAATNNFDQGNVLGRGGQACVFRGVDQIIDEGDAKVCLKCPHSKVKYEVVSDGNVGSLLVLTNDSTIQLDSLV